MAERLLRRITRPLLVERRTAHEPGRRVLAALVFSAWSAQVLLLARHLPPDARSVSA